MFKVLIVDDEYYVMSLITEIVDWNKLNMEVVGTADNGITALELLQELRPDIMIVDVRMPGCDGITLMQRARDLGSDVRFIVISGHRRFDYAKSAMRFNVEDYLLKPISKEELEAILFRLKTQLEQERAKRLEIDQMDNQLGISKGKMHTLLMKELLGGGEWTQMPAEQLNKAYLTEFAEGVCRCVVVKLDSEGQDMDPSFLRDLMQMLEAAYRERLLEICGECVGLHEHMRLYFLIQYPPERERLLLPLLKRAREQVARQLEKFESLALTVGVGAEVNSLADAGISLHGAQRAIDARLSLGYGGTITSDQVREDPGLIRVILSDQRHEQLMDAFKDLDPQTVRKAVEELFEIGQQYQQSATVIIDLCLKIHEAFCEYVQRIDIYKGSYEELQRELWAELEKYRSRDGVKAALLRHITGFIEENLRSESAGVNPSVMIAKRYVQENFHSNISLTSISSVVNLTPVYFSILFKRETGVTFIDYLNRFRVESAKKMLKANRYNINEIAEKCGYQDARYFSKIFKKNVGITPSEYRIRQAGSREREQR